ncbi:MAG: hypothetical protein WCG55_00530 [bacterium]
MKCLDRRGYTYTVYDIGGDRVLKKMKPAVLQRLLHLSSGNSKKYIEQHRTRARLLAETCRDKALIGNPQYEIDGSYTQDRCEVIDTYFLSHTLEENKKCVDMFIECIFETWKNGFSDIIFNFTRNNGLSHAGKVVLFDFNEITFVKNEVLALIETERWLHCYSFTKDLHAGALKDYYAQAMATAMTRENLDRYWKDNEQLLAKTQ